MSGYIRCNLFSARPSLKLLLYVTLVRPKLKYAASVWDPSQDNLIRPLEFVQNNFIRLILSNYSRTESIT